MTPSAALPNGTGPTRAELQERLLGEPLTEGYRPTLPLWALFITDSIPQYYLLRDVELMMIHPVVRSALEFFKGGISTVEFLVRCAHPEVTSYILQSCEQYWRVGMPLVQGGYEYGWIACEALYTDAQGPLLWNGFKQFSPRDVFLLTQDRVPVGVRVKQVFEREKNLQTGKRAGDVDLWMGTSEVPAKGIWYAHNPRYSSYHGQSQLLGAWRPWRRLAWKDGAETNIDLGFYRYFCPGVTIRYPEEDFLGSQGSAATTLDSQGHPRRYGRDMARMIAEQYKSGANVGLPSTKYHPDLGGGDKWALETPKGTLNVGPGLEYAKHLWDQIRYGIGVPPELMEAAETGSGYTGRAIPLEAFLGQQQRLADAILSLFVQQILRPLVRWNFGPVAWDVKVKPLLETKSRVKQAQYNQSGAPAGMPGQNPTQPGSDQTEVVGPARQPEGIGVQSPPLGGWGGFSLEGRDPERLRAIGRRIRERMAA